MIPLHRALLSRMRIWRAPALGCLALASLAACSPQAGSPSASSTSNATQPHRLPVAVAMARGKIDIDGGLLELATAIPGPVRQLPIREGQHVKAGDLLLQLDDEELRAELAVAQSAQRLAQAKQKAIAARLPALQIQLKRLQTAARAGAANTQEVETASEALRHAQSDSDVAQAQVQLAEAKWQQLRSRQRLYQLHAPESATVVHLRAHLGSQVHSSQATMRLLPERPLHVRAELNEAFAATVSEGMRATVVLDNDSSTPLPAAKVVRITPLYGPSALQEDAQRGPARVIECVLEFDTVPHAVYVGQNVRVSFHD